MDLRGFFSENYQLISGLVIFIISLFVISLKSYFAEKGKLTAQISENKRLVEQTEAIKSKFNLELEETKKEHQLEISKRKYQYESKKEQYLKFFRLLDDFSNVNNIRTQENFLPILDEFNRNYLNAKSTSNRKNETNAITVFQKKVQQLMFDSHQDLLRIKQETNTIRLIASEDILLKLDLLTLTYDQTVEASNSMMKDILPSMLHNKQEKMKEHQHKLEIFGEMINDIKNDIISLMRSELNEI